MRMRARRAWPLYLVLLLALMAMPASAARAQAQEKTFPVITGEHWLKATPEQKLAFVAGMATIIELEKEIQGPNPLPMDKSLISGWVKGLQRYTFKQIVEVLDDYYTNHPGQVNKSVVEAMWFQVAEPNINKQ